MLESAHTIGGVWAKERLYPGLKTNNLLGTYEFSDFPMTPERFGVKPGRHIPGSVVHEYLQQYANEFDISSRIEFRCKVLTAELNDNESWILTAVAEEQNDGGKTKLLADHLVCATGLTSDPFIPRFEGSDKFGAPLFHVKEFHNQANFEKAQNVVVLGTSKSAWDAAYAYASRNFQVHLVIRASGHGPIWVAPTHVTPFKIWIELLIMTRFLTWFSPCIWGDADGYGWVRRFLQSTWIGQKLVAGFWFVLGDDVVNLMGYDKHTETKKLRPWNEPFWVASGLALNNYDTDFLQLVRDGKMKIYVADIDRLSEKTVHLTDGVDLPADTLVCSTGWVQRPPIEFLPEGIDASLGLPHYSAEPNELATKADNEVLTRFPRLKNQPFLNSRYKPLTSGPDLKRAQAPNQPYRLYHFISPPSPKLLQARNLAFAGAYLSVSTVTIAQLQALWITAYLGRELSVLDSKPGPSYNDIEWDTVLHSQFGRWRHPASAGGYGEKFPDMAFDTLPYVDLLLRDLCLNYHRKGGLGWKEWFSPYGQADYIGLVEEWKAKRQLGEHRETKKDT